MRTVFVTGCAGFIGSKLTTELLQKGDFVVGIDNINDAYLIIFKEKRLPKHPNFIFINSDIEDRNALISIWKTYTPEVIYHLAGRAGVRYSMDNPGVYYTTNVLGTLNILECMRVFKTPKIIFASTSSVYAGHEMPFVETYSVNEPLSPYAASKKAAENLLYCYYHLYGIVPIVLRFFTVYGPSGRPDMGVLKFIHAMSQGREIQIFGDGTQLRDFTYVDDVVSGIIKSERLGKYEVINLGNNKPEPLHKVIHAIECNLGKCARKTYTPPNLSDAPNTWANIDKATSLLNWKPLTSIDTGIANTVQWYKSQNWIHDLIF